MRIRTVDRDRVSILKRVQFDRSADHFGSEISMSRRITDRMQSLSRLAYRPLSLSVLSEIEAAQFAKRTSLYALEAKWAKLLLSVTLTRMDQWGDAGNWRNLPADLLTRRKNDLKTLVQDQRYRCGKLRGMVVC